MEKNYSKTDIIWRPNISRRIVFLKKIWKEIGFTCHDDLKLENREYDLKFISV